MNNLYLNIKAVYENGKFPLYDMDTSSFSYSNFWRLHTQIYDDFSNSSEQIELLDDYKELLFLSLDTPFELSLHLAVLSSLSACGEDKDLVFDAELSAVSKLGTVRLLDYSKTSVKQLKQTLSLFRVLEELQLGTIDKYVFPFSDNLTPYNENSKFLSWILDAHPDIHKIVQLSQDIGAIDADMMNFDDLMRHVIEIIDSRKLSYDFDDIDIVYD